MTGQALRPLRSLFDQVTGAALVLHDDEAVGMAETLANDRTSAHLVGEEIPDAPRRWGAILLLVADGASLRRAVSVLPRLGGTRSIACWVADAEQPVLALPRPEWPILASLNGRRLPSGAVLTTMRFTRRAPANAVLEELARAAGRARNAGGSGLVVATTNPAAADAPPADPGLIVVPSAELTADPELVVPPDVVLAPPTVVPAHGVIGRAPTVVSSSNLLRGPLDEGVLNPAGFLQRPEHGFVTLEAASGQLALRWPDRTVEISASRGITARHVGDLRQHAGVRVTWDGADTADAARAVAGLAMSGVPVLSERVPPSAADALGAPMVEVLTETNDLSDPLRREEHSVRLRRAALLTHSTLAWRGRLAHQAGLERASFPPCSVVLATKRPHQLEFALAQVAKQRGAQAELILATHGFTADPSRVRDRLGNRPFTLVPMPAEALFGEVLSAGVEAASGDLVVKMDDDDWYGPDFLSDLLLARHYSWADVVGMTPEFVYLEPIDRTIRRTDESERPARFVAGGTMMLERSFLASLGGFRPVTRYVDAQLLGAVHAVGGTVYRTHGLGYVLRRSGSGHTWDPGLDYFLDADRLGEQWPGFVPSRLLDFADAEVPGKVTSA